MEYNTNGQIPVWQTTDTETIEPKYSREQVALDCLIALITRNGRVQEMGYDRQTRRADEILVDRAFDMAQAFINKRELMDAEDRSENV